MSSSGARTEVSQSRNNKRLAVSLLCGVALSPIAEAGIVLDGNTSYGALRPPPPAFASSRTMPGIVFAPGAQTETGYHIQRSQAWRGNSRIDVRTGALLVYPPRVSAIGAPSSARQADLRNNIARANAYRLDYYKR